MKQDLFLKILVWREKHIKEKDFILILSFFIGLLGAVAALMLKEAIHLIQKILTNDRRGKLLVSPIPDYRYRTILALCALYRKR